MGTKSLHSLALAVTAVVALSAAPSVASASITRTSAANHPVIRHRITSAVESSNWSGYAKTGTFTSATATWTVPTVSPTAGPTYSSDWVGIDGYSNSNLIQTGTEQDYSGGRASYRAWWEILPAAETVISSLTISPGDSMTGSITKVSGGWTIKLTDNTTGKSFSTTRSYSGPGTSVDYIQEAPSVNGSIATPAKTSIATFSGLTANGAAPGLTSSEDILLVQNGIVYYTPSAPNSSGNGFSVAYTG